jgi:1,4-dihydroxy-2-naphthoyl-CoA hydrolase
MTVEARMRIEAPRSIEEWNARGRDYLPGLLGLEFLSVGPDEVRARMTVSTAVMAWNGFLHAGAVVALADTCCGYGTVASLPEGAEGFTTIDLVSSFLGTAREGTIGCTATPLHRGRSTQVWDAAVTAEPTGKRIAQFRCTQMVLWSRV